MKFPPAHRNRRRIDDGRQYEKQDELWRESLPPVSWARARARRRSAPEEWLEVLSVVSRRTRPRQLRPAAGPKSGSHESSARVWLKKFVRRFADELSERSAILAILREGPREGWIRHRNRVRSDGTSSLATPRVRLVAFVGIPLTLNWCWRAATAAEKLTRAIAMRGTWALARSEARSWRTAAT